MSILKLKQAFKDGQTLVGTWLNALSPAQVVNVRLDTETNTAEVTADREPDDVSQSEF